MSARRKFVGGVALAVSVSLLIFCAGYAAAQRPKARTAGWQKGKGWGWIWGPSDEVGSLNALTDATRLAALGLIKKGQAYDLGATYSRNSYRWPGHSPGEIITFRTPEGVKRMKDSDFTLPDVNPSGQTWHSCALFMNDNVATQIDGLGHVVVGADNHWYNGFKESEWGGDWGVRKCDATTIPPIIGRGVMIDIAGYKGVDALPAHYTVTVEDVEGALRRQGTQLRVGDVVLFRTGTLRYWGEDGANHKKIAEHDSAGPDLKTIQWLVEQHGPIMVGSDTSGLELAPAPKGSDTFIPVHKYLIIEQGVHIAEFHNLEDLARDRVYEFCYVAMTNKIKGTAAGFALRPIAIR